jgi:hypothetical protein
MVAFVSDRKVTAPNAIQAQHLHRKYPVDATPARGTAALKQQLDYQLQYTATNLGITSNNSTFLTS